MLTGSNKLVLFLVILVILVAEVTIVVILLVALRQDLIRWYSKYGISY